jgi:hypothetical protein
MYALVVLRVRSATILSPMFYRPRGDTLCVFVLAAPGGRGGGGRGVKERKRGKVERAEINCNAVSLERDKL